MSLEDDPVLAALWTKILQGWDDDARHQALLAYCREVGRLEQAARLYRGVVEGKEEGLEAPTAELVASAEKRLKAVGVAALAALQADRTEPGAPKAHRTVRFIGYGVFLLIMVALALALSSSVR